MGLYLTKRYLQLSVVVAHALQEAVVLPGLVCLETQISFQGLLLAFQTLRRQRHITFVSVTFQNISLMFAVWSAYWFYFCLEKSAFGL